MNVEIGRQNMIILTFILDSHQPFICSVTLKEVLLSGIQNEHNSTADMPNK
jgi:hypothetical protein